MAAWPGGACPECGDQMPANLIRCATCRGLLNPDLHPKYVDAVDFVELKEVLVVIAVPVVGHFVQCPHCHGELRIHTKYLGQQVACRFCKQPFHWHGNETLPPKAVYSSCPHCQKEVRAALQFVGENVACKFCSGALKLELPNAECPTPPPPKSRAKSKGTPLPADELDYRHVLLALVEQEGPADHTDSPTFANPLESPAVASETPAPSVEGTSPEIPPVTP